ncbi:MAG: hypothetical protein ACR2J6_07150 [Thermoleophilaceae bacterium]
MLRRHRNDLVASRDIEPELGQRAGARQRGQGGHRRACLRNPPAVDGGDRLGGVD